MKFRDVSSQASILNFSSKDSEKKLWYLEPKLGIVIASREWN